jgi:hypothetical protein
MGIAWKGGVRHAATNWVKRSRESYTAVNEEA